MSPTTPDPAPALAADPNSAASAKAVTPLAEPRPVVVGGPFDSRKRTKLLEGGGQIDAMLYDRLVSHRLAVRSDEPAETDVPVTGALLRGACESAMARRPFFALMGPPGRARGMLLQAIEAIALPPPVAVQLALARETRPALFEHGILMAILCAHLVREGGATAYDMTQAATAGLLQDLGMLHIDAGLLDGGNRLSGDQLRPLYAHPVTSSMLVARFHEYPKQVARAILEHHERLDGSGYPRGLVGEAISPLGRMLGLCDVITAMFGADRAHPEQRASLLLRVSPRQFDPALVPSIHRLLRALPVDPHDVAGSVSDLVDRLRVLANLLNQWHAAAADAAPQVDAAGHAVLTDVADQADTLQRMLFDAGITPEQLGLLNQEDEPDAPYRSELWALSRELHWQLRASANQLRRRWRAGAGGQPFPPPVATWLSAVEALEDPG